MKDYKGMFLPDGEEHLIEWMEKMKQFRDGKPCYQYHKYEEALKHCKKRRVALDMGAHVGLWSRPMAMDFKVLHAFEPMPEHARCWRENLKDYPNAILHSVALGACAKDVAMLTMTKGSSGDTGVALPGESMATQVRMVTIDSFNLENVDFIKCDHEGYEYYAMMGALETIKRCRPIVIVEQKEGHGKRYGISDTAALELLLANGMKKITGISGDYILGW